MNLIDENQALKSTWDCVCLGFDEKLMGRPPRGKIAQVVDWGLSGVVSRFLMTRSPAVMIPTMKKLSFPWVFLDRAPFDGVTKCIGNASGAHWKRILFVVEGALHLKDLSTAISSTVSVEVYVTHTDE